MNHSKKSLFSVGIVFAIWLSLVLACGGGGSSSSEVNPNARVTFNVAGLTITNNDTFDYEQTEIVLNGDYRASYGTIPAGKSVTVPFSSFADSSSTRFNLLDKKPSKVRISGYSKGKRLYGYYEF